MLGSSPDVHLGRDGSRCRRLSRTDNHLAELVYYPAGLRHSRHEHDKAHLTFLLAGGFEDDWEGRRSDPSGCLYGFRPQGVRHACRFGPNGALILSIIAREEAVMARAPHLWLPSGRNVVELHSLLFANCAPTHEVINDLIAAAGVERDVRPATRPPGWLSRTVEELVDDPRADIASIASRAGVHRVHLSRSFQRHFGLSPTRFRLYCRSAQALRQMIEDGEAPAAAAAAAGFADQSHWTRALRATAGISPARLRRLLAA